MRMFQHWRLVTAVLLAATPAVGQGSDPAGAEMLYRQGVDLMAANKWAEACPKLEDSFRLDSTGMTANALARCLEGQGKTASAWVKYQVAREFARKKGATGPERELTVKIDALEKQLAKLLIVVPKEIADLPGLIVKRDGIEVGRGSWGTGLPVDPGPHTLDAQATGKKAWSMQLDVPAGALATAQVAVLIDEAKPVGPVGPVASGPSDATTATPSSDAAE